VPLEWSSAERPVAVSDVDRLGIPGEDFGNLAPVIAEAESCRDVCPCERDVVSVHADVAALGGSRPDGLLPRVI
jgi:hypothetical protein